MEVIAIPQTSNRQMCKKFNKLYCINQELNSIIKNNNIRSDKIKVLQIFYDTEIPKQGKIEFLKLRDGILQIVAPFDWNEFSKFDEKGQCKRFVEYIQEALEEVVLKYSIKKDLIDDAFATFYTMLDEK